MAVLADAFATVTFLIIFGGVLLFLAIGRWHSRSGTEIMDQDRKERWGVQAEIEEGDIREMVDAGNVRRRRRGRPEVSEDQVVRDVGDVELGRLRTEARREQQ
jgi:hypothetical protein